MVKIIAILTLGLLLSSGTVSAHEEENHPIFKVPTVKEANLTLLGNQHVEAV